MRVFASYGSPHVRRETELTEETAMSLENLLIDELKDLYNAENQLVKALPKMAKGAESEDLKELFTAHLEETKGQVERLKQVFELLGKRPTGKTCKAMQGLVEEGKEQLESDEEGAAKDVGIAGAALRVEHYEIAGYTAVIAIAKALGQDEIVELLMENLNEEQTASEKVLAQAEASIEEASAEMEEEDDGEMDEDDEEVDESDADAPARRARGAGTHPTRQSSR
jgi:ferritin-like metal-binding protein YciE